MSNITQTLERLKRGDNSAEADLVQLVYADLRRIAASQLKRERGNHTLQPTALVHETFLKLLRREPGAWNNREHFFRAAARAMRFVLVDYARAANAERRGGELTRVELQDWSVAVTTKSEEILTLDRVLDKLEQKSPRQKTIVEMRYYSGLTEEEIANILNLSVRTVKRDWAVARAWLHGEIYRSRSASASS